MLPAFGASESRALIPIFESAAAKVKGFHQCIRNIPTAFDIFFPLTITVEHDLEESHGHVR
jgi:hypothetical protein